MSPSAWSWDPLILLSVGLVAIVYARGLRRIRRRTRRAAPELWRAWAFGGGLAILIVALQSPISTYDNSLFSMHMLQHMLLVLGAAPLLLIGAPLLPLLWGLPDQERRGVGRLLSRHGPLHTLGHRIAQPLVAEVLFLSTLACGMCRCSTTRPRVAASRTISSTPCCWVRRHCSGGRCCRLPAPRNR